MKKIVAIGSLNMDLVVMTPRIPCAGETILGRDHFACPGGKGANQAFAASKLGGRVELFGCIGSDSYAQRILSQLAASGCGVSGVKAIDGTTGVALICITDEGENTIVVVPGANGRYLESDLQGAVESLDENSIALLQLEIPIGTVIAAARAARARGATVILDPAPALPKIPPELWQYINIVTPNETEAAILLGHPPGSAPPGESGSIAQQIRRLGPQTVVMKLGKRGCLVLDRDVVTEIPAPIVSAVDTTAAGDVFNGALAVGLSEGASLQAACRFAVRAAALSVTRYGAQSSMPARAEVDAAHPM